MKVVFIGGTKRGYLALKALAEAGAALVGVISLQQDEHETARYEGVIRTLARQLRVPICETKWLNDRDYAELLRNEWKPDLGFVVGCRLLLPPEVYSAPAGGMLAIHDSYLPEYRGFAPLNWAILNGASQTGATLFYVGEGTDAGDIAAQRRVPIGPHDTAPKVYERICAATVALVRETYPLLAAGHAPRQPQDDTAATYTCSRTPPDGLIDWHSSAAHIYNQVRALTRPYPGAFTHYRTCKMTIWRASPAIDAPRYAGCIPGRIVRRDPHVGTVDVLTGEGILRLHDVQLSGADSAPAATVIRSVRSTLGLRTVDLIERIETLERRLAELSRDRTLRGEVCALAPEIVGAGEDA